MKAEIIAVGSELLTPFRLDTNSLFLTDQLSRLGIRVTRKAVLGDNRDDLADAFRESAARVRLVISSGGLGPTEDDLTRETLAALLRRPLHLDGDILRGIEERFRRYGRTMPAVNHRQAMVPEGAVTLANTRGTAPGLWLESGENIFVLLPGPPSELALIFEREVRPRLEALAPAVRLHARDLRVSGLTESTIEERIAPIYTQYIEVETTILAAPGEIQIHPRMWSREPAAAEKILDELVEKLKPALGENLFSTSGESMEQVVAQALAKSGVTIATAESCTGGLLAERLTRIPGSSDYFRGGVVCYSNDMKSEWAGVPAELIAAKGAVSAEVATALAEGIRSAANATLGAGITGVAGPGGGSQEKPVGTMHIALADGKETKHIGARFPGERDRVRHQASQTALDMVRRWSLSRSTEDE
jgi:nicotinamide-nucleotide amidase